MSLRFIAHLDMDAFYASVELLRYPHLRGRPLMIGGRRGTVVDQSRGTAIPTLKNYSGRGVITTATYEACARGVHYVIECGNELAAIEVKSGTTSGHVGGLETFERNFGKCRKLVVGESGIPLVEFLSCPGEHWLG
jgi:hypothetical protein